MINFPFYQGGFSTVEILVASSMAMSAIIGAGQVVVSAQLAVTHAELSNQAQQILHEQIQKFAALSYDQVGVIFESVPNKTIEEQRDEFTIRIFLKPLTRFVDELNIEVRWFERGQMFQPSQQLLVANSSIASWADSCTLFWDSSWLSPRLQQTITIPNNANLTDLDAQGNILVVSTDDASAASPDLFIVDITDPGQPQLLSSIDTGPGIAAIQLVGQMVFAANTSTVGQLQVIDLANKQSPQLMAQVQLASSGADGMRGKSLYVISNTVYVAMEKNLASELYVVDIANVAAPQIRGSFETSTQINAIIVDQSLAYIATPTQKQLRVLDVGNPGNIVELKSFSATGYQVQDGRSLDVIAGKIIFGRTVGGFNNPSNHELFHLEDNSSITKLFSVDLAASARSIFWRDGFVFVGTNDVFKEWQVWITTNTGAFVPWSSLDLSGNAVSADCADQHFYVALEHGGLVSIISGE